MKKPEKNELIFYRCSVCGNLIIKLEDSGITPQCCGRDMEVIVPNTEDALEEKHIPVWRMNGCKVMIQVGEKLHPAEKSHYIKWILVKTNCGLYLRNFECEDSPELCINLCRGEHVIEIYGFCNLHGLWMAGEEGDC